MDSPRTVRLAAGSAIVSFSVRWFGVVTVRGRFDIVSATVTRPGNGECEMKVAVEVASNSVRTGISLRDRHLRALRFLGADRDPAIRFESDHVSRHHGVWDVRGRLSLRGQTRDIKASVRDESSTEGNRLLTAEFTVPRGPHGIGSASGIRRLNPLLWAIGEDVSLRVQLLVPATLLQQVAEHAPAR